MKKKNKKMTSIVDISLRVPFWSYKNKKLDKKSLICINKEIRNKIRDNISFIDLQVEKDPLGGFYGDCTENVSIKKITIRMEK